MLDILFKVFNVIMDADATIADQFLKFHQFNASNFASAAEGNAFLLEEGDRDFSQPIALAEAVGLGEGVGKVEGNCMMLFLRVMG